MSDNDEVFKTKKTDYRELVDKMGKKEFTLLKMQEYGFWPKDLPTPYERQKNETKEGYVKRRELLKEYEKIINHIAKLYEEKDEINLQLRKLRKEYDETWDYEKIRLDIAQKIMAESIARRRERKAQQELQKRQKSEAWQQRKSEQILFIGRGYSQLLHEKECDEAKLLSQGMPLVRTDRELAALLGVEYKELRFMVYHRDAVTADHYFRYTVPKRRGGVRKIAAPKSTLKAAQRKILETILCKVPVSEHAHGFLKGKSVVSGAKVHTMEPELLLNMDLENFFPTITFERVRGMFKAFGYSGYIASLLAMLCTYCERMPIEVKGEIKYVKTSDRILPQGSPASPMLTNILCVQLDKRLAGLAAKFGFVYSRYADDMSFSLNAEETLQRAKEDTKSQAKDGDIGRFCGLVSKIVKEEGFKINQTKTKFLRKNNRQSITGVVINNEQIGVPKEYIKRLRAAIYNANKMKANGSVPAGMLHEIVGMTAWVKSVNADRYEAIINEAQKLTQHES